ncbi:MAG: hypothetical protein ACYTGF_07755 [Planctomycetota bacterium]
MSRPHCDGSTGSLRLGSNHDPRAGRISSRAPPSDARTPPTAPPIRALTYVSDLEFVGDPGPAEPVWSAD